MEMTWSGVHFEKFIGKRPGDLKMKCKTACDLRKNQLGPLLCTQGQWE